MANYKSAVGSLDPFERFQFPNGTKTYIVRRTVKTALGRKILLTYENLKTKKTFKKEFKKDSIIIVSRPDYK